MRPPAPLAQLAADTASSTPCLTAPAAAAAVAAAKTPPPARHLPNPIFQAPFFPRAKMYQRPRHWRAPPEIELLNCAEFCGASNARMRRGSRWVLRSVLLSKWAKTGGVSI